MSSESQEIVSTLSYRLYEDKDTDGILELWEKYSGWGGITRQQFDDWYLQTPYGQCIIVLAIDEDGNIAGQAIFTPTMVVVSGQKITALRIAAPILNDKARQNNIKKSGHPVFSLLSYGLQIARQEGYGLLYSFPAQGWATIMKMFPQHGLPAIEVSTYECLNISLSDKLNYKPYEGNINIRVRKGAFDFEYDQLFEDAVVQFPIECAIVRSARWLNWKLGSKTILEFRETTSDRLTGYIALKKDGLVIDMLARTKNDAKNMLSLAINSLHHANPDRNQIFYGGLKLMATPLAEFLLEGKNIERTNFNFAFGYYFVSDNNKNIQISSSVWYMMPND